MTDVKLTDNEVLSNLDRLIKKAEHDGILIPCVHRSVLKCSLDLINRLQAENERLLQKLQQPQTEAIKEFAERLKEKAYLNDRRIYVVLRDDIDDVKKEMVGEE